MRFQIKMIVMSSDVGRSEIIHCTISIKDGYNILNASAVMSIDVGPREIKHCTLSFIQDTLIYKNMRSIYKKYFFNDLTS